MFASFYAKGVCEPWDFLQARALAMEFGRAVKVSQNFSFSGGGVTTEGKCMHVWEICHKNARFSGQVSYLSQICRQRDACRPDRPRKKLPPGNGGSLQITAPCFSLVQRSRSYRRPPKSAVLFSCRCRRRNRSGFRWRPQRGGME